MKWCHPLIHLATLIGLTASVCGQVAVRSTQASTTVAQKGLDPGIVVERIAKNSVGEKAGLKEGDILLRWSRGDSAGQTDSPLDLSEIEVEQSPRGSVTLTGIRGTESKTWLLEEGTWGIDTRANLTGKLLSRHTEAHQAAKSGKIVEAAELWKAAAQDAQAAHLPSWLASWFFLRSADWLANGHKVDQADAGCRQAVELTMPSDPAHATELSRECADIFYQLGGWDQAGKYYQQALTEIRKKGDDTLVAAVILGKMGGVALYRDELAKAEDLDSQSIKILERLAPNTLAHAAGLNRLGVLMQSTSQLDGSKEYLRRAVAITEKLIPDTVRFGNTLENFANTLTMRGDLNEAEPYLVRALKLFEKLDPDGLRLAGCLVDLEALEEARGDLANAELHIRRALAIQSRLRPKGGGAVNSMNNLGVILEARGQYEEAENYHLQVLAIRKEASPNSLDVAGTLVNLGLLNRDRGDLVKADQCLHQGLAIYEALAPTSLNLGTSYYAMGTVASLRRDWDVAEDYYRRALVIAAAAAPGGLEMANSLKELGKVLQAKGKWTEAEKSYLQASNILQAMAPASTGHAEALMGLAETKRHEQQLDASAQLFEQALNALEGQTAQLGGANEVRAGFRGSFDNYYKNYIDLLIAQGKPERAFHVLEQSRAYALLETLAAGHVDIRKGVDAELVEQEHSLQGLLRAKYDRRIRLLSDKHTEEQVAVVDKEIKELSGQYREVEGQIRSTSPVYAALTQPQPLSAKQVQEQLLDNDTLLLEYSLGEERSYLFALTPSSLNSYELPKRAEIESKTRSLYDLLTERDRPLSGESLRARQTRISKAEAEYRDAASALSRILLGPVAGLLAQKRLLIVSDGALHYVPFAALPVPRTSGQDSSSTPLMVDHEIVNLPSASTLAVLRHEQADRKQPTKQVVVLADPVFDKQDARVKSTGDPSGSKGEQRSKDDNEADLSNVPSMRQLTRSAADLDLAPRGELRLPRLPFTRDEAKAILAVVPLSAGKEALDFDASRKFAVSGELTKYHVVHFATHALVDNVHPELSGLVLSLVDQQGAPQDGFLVLQDIYDLDLPADLVVLSACQTGLGKQINGEGMIGLTRGFMYAGASSVVSTLWKVDDFATAKLMGHFYRAMERGRMTPAQALRQAQLALWKEGRWSAPYYWAGFTLQGEWK